MDFMRRVERNYQSALLFSLQDMVKNEFICDFTIGVGEVFFPAHRVVLAGSSKYFKAMFSSEMKEVKEGFVQMIGVETIAMKISIDFMYTGTAEVNSQTVEHILSAATLMELKGLADLCFHFLKTNLTTQSCLRAVWLANLYGEETLKASAEQFILRHFEDVIDEPNFPDITKNDLKRYIKSLFYASHEITWKAVVAWMVDDFDTEKGLFLELVRFIGIQDFTFKQFNEVVMNKTNLPDEIKSQIAEQYFSDLENFKSRLSKENYFTIKSLIDAYAIPDKERFEELLRGFLNENFEQLSQTEEFVLMTEEEVLPVMKNTKNQYFSEQTKWEAAVKWVEHDENRTNTFPRFFSSINLSLLPSGFVQESICDHDLVNESHHCKDLLLKYLCNDVKSTPHITWLDKSGDEILTFDPVKNRTSVLFRKEGGVGIANINGNLFLATKDTLCRLSRNGTWTTLPRPPREIKSPCNVLCFQRCVYVIDNNATQWYDPSSNKWTDSYCGGLADGTCVAASDDTIYALGGLMSQRRGWGTIPTDEMRTFLSSSWSISSSKMQNKRSYASAAFLRDIVWVMGGGVNAVEFYQPVSRVWTEISQMLVSRNNFGCCVLGNRLYAIGGRISYSESLVEGDSIDSFDVETREWKIIQTIKRTSNGVSCCSYSPSEKMLKLSDTIYSAKALDG